MNHTLNHPVITENCTDQDLSDLTGFHHSSNSPFSNAFAESSLDRAPTLLGQLKLFDSHSATNTTSDDFSDALEVSPVNPSIYSNHHLLDPWKSDSVLMQATMQQVDHSSNEQSPMYFCESGDRSRFNSDSTLYEPQSFDLSCHFQRPDELPEYSLKASAAMLMSLNSLSSCNKMKNPELFPDFDPSLGMTTCHLTSHLTSQKGHWPQEPDVEQSIPEKVGGSDKKSTKKKGGRKRKSGDMSEARQRFLERNRLAAMRCRQKKREWLKSLETRLDYLSHDNELLEHQISGMKEEIVNIKTLLLANKHCKVALRSGMDVKLIESAINL